MRSSRSPTPARRRSGPPSGRASFDPETLLHHAHRLRIRVDEDVAAAELGRGCAERPASGEGIEAPVAFPRGRLDGAAEDAERFLRRVTGFFLPGRRDDRVPPNRGWQLPSSRLVRRDEAGRHVRLAVDGLRIEVVALRVLDVDEDRVVLRRPAAAGARAVVVRPDDLVEEALPAEDLVA